MGRGVNFWKETRKRSKLRVDVIRFLWYNHVAALNVIPFHPPLVLVTPAAFFLPCGGRIVDKEKTQAIVAAANSLRLFHDILLRLCQRLYVVTL